MKERKYAILMTMGAIFWAGAFIAGKIGVGDTSPLLLTYFRFLVAIVFMYPYLKYKNVDLKIKGNDWILMITLGLVGMTGYHLLFFSALKFVALTGVLLTLGNWDISILWTGGFNIGDIIMLSAVTCWAVYGIIVRLNVKKHEPMVMTFYSFLTCLLILTPFFSMEVIKTGISISKNTWIAIIYMGIFPTFIGYLIQQMTIKELGVSKMALFINLVPVFSMMMAITILKEELFLLNLVSSAMILLSVYLFVSLKTE